MSLILALAFGALAATQMPESPRGQFVEKEHRGEHGTRKYRLYIPSAHEASRPAPLVVMLHGCTQDAMDFAAGTRMNELAEAGGFLVAYPEQSNEFHPQKCWSWYDPDHQKAESGEAALIAALTREVIANYSVDARRVFIAGISAGGAMAVITAATHPGLYAAVGVHSGVAFRSATSVQEALLAMSRGVNDPSIGATEIRRSYGSVAPPRLILFHGCGDAVVSVNNGKALGQQWALVHGLAESPVDEMSNPSDEHSRYSRRVWHHAKGGAALVESWLVNDLGHAWSGGSPDGTYTEQEGPDASREMIRFFLDR
jgi:poly(hydroxyalkanoate) depolymerase family esterase